MSVHGTAVVLVHMLALSTGLLRVAVRGNQTEARLGELVCSGLFFLNFYPFVRGLFANRGCGIPWSVILKAGVMVAIFLHLCRTCPLSLTYGLLSSNNECTPEILRYKCYVVLRITSQFKALDLIVTVGLWRYKL